MIYALGDEAELKLALLMDNVGWYLNLNGKTEEAAVLHRRALEARENLLDPEYLT